MRITFFLLLFSILVSCNNRSETRAPATPAASTKPKDTSFFGRLSDSAVSLTLQDVSYDAGYFSIPYPNGDVPANKGVCCDVIIRAYRKLGIDLQKEVHEDMAANFSAYPKSWGLHAPDKNIDHRRVPNLMNFFSRQGAELPISADGKDYLPGDIVCWMLPHDLTHIGIVIDSTAPGGDHNLIVHNIGGGQVVADCLFKFKVIGHYRWR